MSINHVATSNSDCYTTAIAAGASEVEYMPGLPADGMGCIRTIQVESIDANDWQVEILDASSKVVGRVELPVADASVESVDGADHYFYSASVELPVPNVQPFGVPVAVRNNSAVAKTEGANLTVTIVASK